MTLKTWAEYSQRKIIPPDQLAGLSKKLKTEGKTVATLNGSFDFMHAGHLHIIFEASQVADVLIVALNTDRSIQAYKSADRPIIALNYRLEMMAALGFVDYVTWFDETDPRQVLSVIQPDVHVNGAEYGEDCIEKGTVKAHGGRMHIVSLLPGLSTSTILKKIQQLGEKK